MSDYIKREDAIRAIDELPNCYNGWSDTYDKAHIIETEAKNVFIKAILDAIEK